MTSAEGVLQSPPRRGLAVPFVLRLALRELRAGLRGFYVFIACIALGVAVIAAVGTLSDALRAGFETQGQRILGGDLTLARVHKRAEREEQAYLTRLGSLSETATLRIMARRADGSEQALAELKAIDRAYPLAGTVRLQGGGDLDRAVRAGPGAVVEPIVLERLRIKVGDTIRIGSLDVPVTGVIAEEPDTISDRMTFGPRILVSMASLEQTGLVTPGSLIRWRYAVRLPDGEATAGRLVSLRQQIGDALPEAGFTIADRRDPSPQVSRTLDRLRDFLTLIGLTALLVGGVGVANAVATFVDRRRKVIATMKSLGATGGMIFSLFLAQVMLIAGVGIAIGLVVGTAAPFLLDAIWGEALPIRAELSVRPASLVAAAAYGILVALVFALWPLGRAEMIRAGVLFREEIMPAPVRPRAGIMLAAAGAAVALVGLAVLSSGTWLVALYFCLAVAVVLGLFAGLGQAVTALARRVPRPRRPEIALAIGNIAAPGGLTRSVVLSLGAGLSLLVAVALADASLVAELTGRMPAQGPAYFVLDITRGQARAFNETVQKAVPAAGIAEAPMLRGRLVRLGDTPVEQIKAPPEAQWVLTGDRGLTYSDAVPDGSRVVAGTWWPADYAGEPLVSFDADMARRLALKIGDTITVNVLGRNVTARIASLREVKWESLAINFVMVFSPNTLRGAPHNLIATITLPPDTPLTADAALARAIADQFPAVTSIRVKDAIASFSAVFGKVMTAVRVAGSLTLVAGALVLAGALATAQRRRIQQAVVLKVLGASRARVLALHFAEYGLLATGTALLAVLVGTIAASLALKFVLDVDFVFSVRAVAEALVVSLGLVALFGGLGTWQVLNARPVSYLRTE